MFEGYFDESERTDDRIFSVAGILVEKDEAILFTEKWNAVLSEHSLEYFRMSECNSGNGQFKGRSENDCDLIARKMIAIVNDHRHLAVGVSIDQEYSYLIPPSEGLGVHIPLSDYTFCCYWVTLLAANWLDGMNADYDRHIFSFFESGDDHSAEAHAFLTSIYKNEEYKHRFRYGGHAFLPKIGNPLLQGADMFAWHWARGVATNRAGGRPRGDLRALGGPGKTYFVHFTEAKLLRLIRKRSINPALSHLS